MINPCCCGCDIFNDTFSDTLAPEWEQVAGSWSTSAGAITTTSTSAMVIHEAESPVDAGRVNVSTTGTTINPASAIWYLIGAYKDANNYLYCKFTNIAGAYTITLGYFEAGVDTVIATDSNLGGGGATDNFAFRLCWDGTRAVGGFANDAVSGDFTPVAGGNRAGFATGPAGTSWTFPDFDFSHHKEKKGSCPSCRSCWDSCETFPETIEAYIPAGTFSTKPFIGAGRFCTANCENLNDQTYILTRIDESFRGCPVWEYTEEDFCSIESPGGGPAVSADLFVRVVNFVVDGNGGTRWTLGVHITSACVPGVSGNRTEWGFTTDDLHPTWDDCIELEYETSHNTITSPTTACAGAGVACNIDDTKKPTITFL